MAVLAGWESIQVPKILVTRLTRTPLPTDRYRAGRRPVRRPAGLTAASPVRPAVTSCASAHGLGRAAALLLAVLVAVIVAGLLVLRAAAADDGVPQRTAVVEVRNGETLWDLAERVAPQSPPKAVVERIRELNGMQGSTVHPGQPLLVPDGR